MAPVYTLSEPMCDGSLGPGRADLTSTFLRAEPHPHHPMRHPGAALTELQGLFSLGALGDSFLPHKGFQSPLGPDLGKPRLEDSNYLGL